MSSNPADWEVAEVRQWLSSIDLAQYSITFSEHRITGLNLLSGFSHEDFEVLGIKALGHRKTIASEIQKLGGKSGSEKNVQSSQWEQPANTGSVYHELTSVKRHLASLESKIDRLLHGQTAAASAQEAAAVKIQAVQRGRHTRSQSPERKGHGHSCGQRRTGPQAQSPFEPPVPGVVPGGLAEVHIGGSPNLEMMDSKREEINREVFSIKY